MKPKHRQLKITDLIRKEGRVTVDQLVDKFKSSPETIRRDLSVLALSGKVQKIHGGAKYSSFHGEGPFQQRMSENIVAKRIIAEKASKLISSGDSILINAGSTTVIFAEELTKINDLTVITNSLDIAKIIGGSKKGSKVYLLGGEYSQNNHQTLGTMIISQLQHFHVQHLILPIGFIDASVGVTDFYASDVAVSQAMLERAQKSIILADSSKFNQIAPFIVGSLSQFDTLVCENSPEGLLKDALQKNHVEIL
ncbi:MAG: DeoR/GlpR family DNA-binding transcription regulator [Cocleimonas sp.]